MCYLTELKSTKLQRRFDLIFNFDSYSDKSIAVCEEDLGLDTFTSQIEQNKEHFANLIEDIVQAFNKDKQVMQDKLAQTIERADKDNQGTLLLLNLNHFCIIIF